MSELSEADAGQGALLPTIIPERVASSNKQAVLLWGDAQKVALEELVFLCNEMLDRSLSETHLMLEFIAKIAGVHSVQGARTMLQECGQHQIDFIKRDCERMFKHQQRLLDVGLKLSGQQPKN